MVQNRNIAMCIVLSLVTCGIYGLYWFVTLTDDTNTVSGETEGTSGGMALLLTIVTCGIYGWYWAYKQGEKMDKACMSRGMVQSNSSVLYLLLCIVGLAIVAYAIMQDKLNQMSNMGGGSMPY